MEYVIPLENDYTYDIAMVFMIFETTLIAKTKDHHYGIKRSPCSKELNERREDKEMYKGHKSQKSVIIELDENLWQNAKK